MTSALQDNPAEAGKDGLGVTARGAAVLLNTDIDSNCYNLVSEVLATVGPQEHLTLVLESLGGSIEWAFWIAKALKENCQTLDVAIPCNAKSAATLIALAADRILMGRRGELGPLDPQRPDPTGGALPRSPLEAIQGLQYLRTYYLESIDAVMLHLIRNAAMDIPYALQQTPNVLAPAISSLYQNVNVREIGDAYRALLVGERYAKELMRRWSPLPEPIANQIVESLVWDYPDHGHIIDIYEAHRIGLSNAVPLEPVQDGLLFQSVQSDPEVRVIDLSEIDRLTTMIKDQEGNCQNEESNCSDQQHPA